MKLGTIHKLRYRYRRLRALDYVKSCQLKGFNPGNKKTLFQDTQSVDNSLRKLMFTAKFRRNWPIMTKKLLLIYDPEYWQISIHVNETNLI